MSRGALGAALTAAREVVSSAVHEASEDDVPMMAAAISYYLLVTIAPLALALAVVASVVRGAVGVAAGSPAEPVAQVMARYSDSGALVALVALGVLLFGASGVFSQFALAITRVWKEPTERGPLFSFARRHLIGFVLLIVLAVGLLISLVLGSVLSAITAQFGAVAASLGVQVDALGQFATGRVLYDFVAASLLFTAAFSLVPSRRLRARDVAPGALLTAAAYAVGQLGLTYYLGRSSRVDLYGSAAGFIAVMLWAYYSAMIALYGAEITKAIVLRKERGDTAR